MGVDIATYRARIGTFSMPFSSKSLLHGYVVSIEACRMSFRLSLLVCSLVVLCGDVEVNPGPSSKTAEAINQPPATRQSQLSFSQISASPLENTPPSRGKKQPQNVSDIATGNADILKCLQDMRSEVRGDLATLNGKIDDINSSICRLSEENNRLKLENMSLKNELKSVRSKVDILESHFRRNNLKFYGIHGNYDEKWSDTEQRVRTFIGEELNRPDLENIDIERAHRLKSRDREKCTIIVKFTKFKDKEVILSTAKQRLKNSQFSVHEDFTERVMIH